MKINLVLIVLIILSLLYLRHLRSQRHADAPSPSAIPATEGPPVEFVLPSKELSIVADPNLWPTYRQEDGISIYKQDGRNNYLFVIDTNIKNVSVKNLFKDMDGHWNSAFNPVCVLNGGFFEPNGDPSFPITENGWILPGAVTDQYLVRMLYINGQTLSMADIVRNEEVVASQFAISGLRPSSYLNDPTITNRTVIAINQNLLYIFVTQSYTIDQLVNIFTGTIEINLDYIIALDSGYSSQVRCFGEDLIKSKSVMGSTLIISNP